MNMLRPFALWFTVVAAVLLAGCTGARFEPPEVQGWPLMVEVDGKPVLLALVKQEDVREVRFGGGRRSTSTTRRDTYFHFELRAYDPATATPLWRRRVLSLGDPDAKKNIPLTRVVGSSESGYLLGQDGDLVWLQIADSPAAVSVRDGTIVVTAETLESANPELKGRLPSEARHYGFDGGLVLHAADARQWRVRGAEGRAEAYTPPPPAVEAAPLKANGMPKTIPLRPYGEAPARLAQVDGTWIGLFTEKEAPEAANDQWGDRFAYPYSIHDEGAAARRTFWTVRTETRHDREESFEAIAELTPIPGTPTYLRGRFVKQLPGDTPMAATDPAGVFVWHVTRMDDIGRLALARLDAKLQPLWTTELPLSDNSTGNPVRYWLLGDRIAVMGGLRTEADFIVGNELMLVSVGLADGDLLAHNLSREPTDEHDATRVPPRDAGPVAAP